MDYKILLLLALCAFATALPREKGLQTSESSSSSEESVEETTTAERSRSKIILVNDAADLNTRIAQAGDKVVLVFFLSTSCPYCKKVVPTVEDVADTTDNLIVLKVDRDILKENQNAKGWSYGLSELPSVPRFIFVKNGAKVEEIHGSDSDIRGTVAKVLSPSFVVEKSTENPSNIN